MSKRREATAQREARQEARGVQPVGQQPPEREEPRDSGPRQERRSEAKLARGGRSTKSRHGENDSVRARVASRSNCVGPPAAARAALAKRSSTREAWTDLGSSFCRKLVSPSTSVSFSSVTSFSVYVGNGKGSKSMRALCQSPCWIAPLTAWSVVAWSPSARSITSRG